MKRLHSADTHAGRNKHFTITATRLIICPLNAIVYSSLEFQQSLHERALIQNVSQSLQHKTLPRSVTTSTCLLNVYLICSAIILIMETRGRQKYITFGGHDDGIRRPSSGNKHWCSTPQSRKALYSATRPITPMISGSIASA